MPKGLKIALITIVPLLLLVGILYGLLKLGVVKAPNTPALQPILKAVGLTKPGLPALAGAAPAPDPLAGEKQALTARREALEKEKTNWEDQKQLQMKAEAAAKVAAANALPDSKNLARMASVYEQMPAKAVSAIFAKLPDAQVIELLRRMDEKQVALILAIEPPMRAARLTLALSRPSPERTASNTP